MSEQTQPKKPLALLHDEAEADIFNAVSMASRTIPFYLIEGIMTNLLHQVRERARAEREEALRIYDKQLEEYNRVQESGEAESEDESCKIP